MDIKQILLSRANRGTRIARPLMNFLETHQQCVAAGRLILEGAVDPIAKTLIERSAVISEVTAIEVYFRDVLDFIFKYCAPKFFEPHLKHLMPDKFDIAELLELYRHQVHPLELVSSSQSFQNAERIDRVFSKFVPTGGLWSSVLKLKVRVKDQPETETSFDHETFDALKRTFALRHELVHDPARRSFFTEDTLLELHATAHMILGADIVLTNAIQENRDPELESEARPTVGEANGPN